ncbi:MAG: hypothetical protein MZW92_49550 [Comamonadaceae bacterium]|nr:hypothetical protein [Comamonadaceae bacterium]
MPRRQRQRQQHFLLDQRNQIQLAFRGDGIAAVVAQFVLRPGLRRPAPAGTGCAGPTSKRQRLPRQR